MRFGIEDGLYGPRLAVAGAWSDEIAEAMVREGIRELKLNHVVGFEGNDISFLKSLPFLEGLMLLLPTLKDDSIVETLSNLRHLQLSTYCRNPLSFASLPKLENCALDWRPKGMDGLFACTRLKRLWLGDYPGEDFKTFAQLSELSELILSAGLVNSTSGLESLRALERVRFMHLRRLEDFTALSYLPKLRLIEILKCPRLANLDWVTPLRNLRELQFDNCGPVQSLSPIAGMKNLESISFVESTSIIDGDLDVLRQLPSLRDVRFANRKHYSQTSGQIREILLID